LDYARQVLDNHHFGSITIQQIATKPLLGIILVPHPVLHTNNTKDITNALKKYGTSGYLSIDRQLTHH
jgi:hypothetical protein